MYVFPDSYPLPQVKAYAQFLLDHYLPQLADENLRLAKRDKLPLLNLFGHLPEAELYNLTLAGLQQFLKGITEEQALQQAFEAIQQWQKNELPDVSREQVKGADLVISYSIQKKLLYSFLPRYTRDADQIILITLELEEFYSLVQQAAFTTFIDIQQNELLVANEELKAHQEELQTLNEDLKESQEEYEAVNEELIEQIYLRRDIEDALRQSEAKFRLMAENASDVISTHSPDGCYVYISPSCESVMGYPPREIIGKHPSDFIHPEDVAIVEQSFAALLQQSGEPYLTIVYRTGTKQKTYKWIESVCHAVRDVAGKHITEFQVASRDISKRKEIEASLEREREYFQAVLENISDGIVACDEKGILSFFNKATRLFHGLPEQPIPPDQWATYYSLYYPDGLTPLKQEDIPLYRALQGESVSNLEMKIVPAEGKPKMVLCDGTRIITSSGKILGAVAVMHDITDRKEAQAKLIRSEAMLVESQAIAHVGSWEWDIEADRIIWSTELKRIYGYPLDIEGLTYDEFLAHVHPEDRDFTHQTISRTFETHQPFIFQHRIISKTGKTHWLQARGKAIVSPQGKLIKMTGTGQDITELKKTEEALHDKNLKLSQALEELKVAEETLVKINSQLEAKVKERTLELQVSEEELRHALEQSIELNKKLAESEIFLSSIIDQSPISTWISDAQGTQIRVNEACMKLFGITDATLGIGKYNILKDDVLQSQPFFEDIAAVFTEGKMARFSGKYNISQVSHVNIPNGRSIHLVVTIFPIKNSKGEVTHAVIQHEDVTQQIAAQEALQVSEERYRFMADSIPHIVWTATPDGSVDYFNKQWTDFTGLHFDAGKPNEWATVIHPEDLPLVANSWAKTVRMGTEFLLKFRMLRNTDEYRWVFMNAIPYKNEQNEIIKWFGTTTDIHEQQLTLEALTEARRQFQFLAEFIPQIVWRTEANGNHDYFNQRWYDYTGLSYEESKNKGWSLVLHPDDYGRTQEVWNHSLASGNSYEMEYRFRKHDGTYRWFLARALPIRDIEGNIIKWFGTCTDIHDQIEAVARLESSQQELSLKNQELNRINNDLDNFIYTASHDLKAPISNLEGLINLLEMKMDTKLQAPVKRIIELIGVSVGKLKRTIVDLTEITKVQKELHAEAEPVDLEVALRDVKTDVAQLIAESDASIQAHFEVPTIRFARKNIRSILYNLLTNALKYRSPDRRVQINIRTIQQDSYILLSFADNGLGIQADQIEKIFLMFKRVHTHVEGSGIGLYIVKRIIENNGGKIEVESEPGKGTTFNMYFKLL
ncbi:PAS domain S-box protein [Rhodocytophaga aerolata]|uniref:histidine kinase n=1 Tax=Rhodocytophaga aerolata TaxID=455078 RepID=A0ABT8QY39_9BACT|nr:PAS domain S-box protein [Rhodocytophaga aerolata]MDO1444752.1 PAS domain S-box protein [Rhodocytophaga aerolata]